MLFFQWKTYYFKLSVKTLNVKILELRILVSKYSGPLDTTLLFNINMMRRMTRKKKMLLLFGISFISKGKASRTSSLNGIAH